MDWILLCVLFISVTTTLAHRYFESYPHHHHQEAESIESIRYDFKRPESPPDWRDERNHKMSQRSAQRDIDRSQRMSERSIAVSSGIQSVQEYGRNRVQSRAEEGFNRNDNGTYKIVNIGSRRGQIDSMNPDMVVFPGPTSKSSEEFVPDVPESCLKTGICDNVPNYPTELANRLIAQIRNKKERFTIDVLDEPEIAQRLGPADQNIELCNYHERIVMPEAAPDKNGKWHFILNTKENPIQGYRVEVCENNGGSCADGIAYFNDGYVATCKQKYVQRAMTAFDRDGNIKYDMPFRIPSCCSCVASHVGRF